MELETLLKGVLKIYSSLYSNNISKTKLLKLAYLVEVEFYRRNKNRLTNSVWTYYLYGPYVFDYDSILSTSDFGHEAYDVTDEKKADMISLKNDALDISIDSEIHFLIKRVLGDFGNYELRKLLDYVYFETEPMMAAEQRMETLDFSTIMPVEYYKEKNIKIDEKTKRKLDQEFKKRLEDIRAKR